MLSRTSATFLAGVLLLCCSSYRAEVPVDTESSTDPGRSSSGESGDAGADAQFDADDPPQVDAAPKLGCQECVMSSCDNEAQKCFANAACTSVLMCANRCPDFPCQRQCNTPANGLFVDYERCITDVCKSSCGK
jgi:hypothetical protein